MSACSHTNSLVFLATFMCVDAYTDCSDEWDEDFMDHEDHLSPADYVQTYLPHTQMAKQLRTEEKAAHIEFVNNWVEMCG